MRMILTGTTQLLVLTMLSSAEGAPSEPFILMTASVPNSNVGGSIFRMDPRTFDNYKINHLVTLYHPVAVDYDPVRDEIYWSEVGDYKRIRKSTLEGKFTETVMDGEAESSIEGLAVDADLRLLFYTDAFFNVIGRFDLDDPKNRQLIITTKLERPRAIVVDTEELMLYWVDWGQPAKIERATYGGFKREELINSNTYFVNALALDIPNKKMYWVDAGIDTVEMANMDGSRREILFPAASKYHFFGMALFENSLYITDWGDAGSSATSSKLIEITLDGDGYEKGTLNVGRLNDIHAYSPGHSLQAQAGWTKTAVIAAVISGFIAGHIAG